MSSNSDFTWFEEYGKLDKLDIHIIKSPVMATRVVVYALTDEGKTVEFAVKSVEWQYHDTAYNHELRDRVKPSWEE